MTRNENIADHWEADKQRRAAKIMHASRGHVCQAPCGQAPCVGHLNAVRSPAAAVPGAKAPRWVRLFGLG